MTMLIGLMITKEDHDVFADWCSDQLCLYDAVVCLDGSSSRLTSRIAQEFPDRLIYLHESQYRIQHATDHGLRAIVHNEIVQRFGHDNWIMCCHADEFCYHDPRKVVELAEKGGFDLVSWYSPHFYPHPSELADLEARLQQPIHVRFQHYHWGYLESDLPWVEDRLYRNSEGVCWDGITQGSVRPFGLERQAPFKPILKHFKVVTLDTEAYESVGGHTLYKHHWVDQGEFRTGVAFSVHSPKELFVERVPKYRYCNRFEARFDHAWNMGDAFAQHHPRDNVISEVASSEFHDLIESHSYRAAEVLLNQDRRRLREPKAKSVVSNNFGVLQALQGAQDDAILSFAAAVALDRTNVVALANISEIAETNGATAHSPAVEPAVTIHKSSKTRIAILSLLFNWPSTGGGTIHTKELAEFLSQAGYDVLHLFARFEPWGVGNCDAPLSVPTQALSFDDKSWHAEGVVARFHSAVEVFQPNYVIVTDSWNFKPWLAKAAGTTPYLLRYQALETLCPLNNIRLLPDQSGNAGQCGRHQFATPADCHRCCDANAMYSGQLHAAERRFSRVGTAEYDQLLRGSLRDALAVFVVNPLMEAMLSPWTERIRVVPAGMDPARFRPDGLRSSIPRLIDGRKRLLFAGLTQEYMKGFHVLTRACELLWAKRQDFEVVVTGEPVSALPCMNYIGWLDQQELAKHLMASDMLVFPTIAQEALGRSAVEAMAAAIPVVASRIGGLSFTVIDGHTGLLVEPGDHVDLAQKIERLLDDPDLRRKLGEQGRRRFEEAFSWPGIIDRHYKSVLAPVSPRG